MQSLIRCATLCFAALFISTISLAQSAPDALRHDLDSLFKDSKFSNATFGVCVQSLKTEEYLYRLNDQRSLVPASNMKLFTAASALALLGSDFQYQTQYLVRGTRRGKTLDGDLIVRGSGDPSFLLTIDTFQTDVDTARSAFADLLAGLRSITGSVVIDNSYFTDAYYPVAWQVDDLAYYYAPPVSATVCDGNRGAIYVNGLDKAGKPAWVGSGSEDQLPYGVIINLATTGPDSSPTTLNAARKFGTDTIFVTGSIPRNGIEWLFVSIKDPVERCRDYFQTVLAENQISFPEKNTKHNAKETILAVERSRQLSKLVFRMNKESDNLYAECFLRTVGKEKGGEGSWTRGIDVMRKYLGSIGIDTVSLQFTDGSGLSRMDLVTPEAIVKLLAYWYPAGGAETAPLQIAKEAFYNSLPIAGVDGTFKNHLKGTPAEGNVRGKSGSMTGVRALSGYLMTKDGEPVAYSIIANNYTAPGSDAGKLEDSMVLRLVNFSRK